MWPLPSRATALSVIGYATHLCVRFVYFLPASRSPATLQPLPLPMAVTSDVSRKRRSFLTHTHHLTTRSRKSDDKIYCFLRVRNLTSCPKIFLAPTFIYIYIHIYIYTYTYVRVCLSTRACTVVRLQNPKAPFECQDRPVQIADTANCKQS
jgi:hypothetical protein